MKDDTIHAERHPLQCHLCPHSAEVARTTARLAEIEDELQRLADERARLEEDRDRLARICGTCEPRDDWTHRGRETSLDAMGGADVLPAPATPSDAVDTSVTLGELTPEEESGALKVLQKLVECDWRGVLLIWAYIREVDRAQVARLLGVGKSRLHYHLHAALNENPILRRLYYPLTRIKAES